MRTFRCIYVNCFNRLRFLAEVSTKLKKCTSLDNLRTITQEGNMCYRPFCRDQNIVRYSLVEEFSEKVKKLLNCRTHKLSFSLHKILSNVFGKTNFLGMLTYVKMH